MVRVLINAFDSATARGPFPNLACMKVATHHRFQGHEVALVGKGLSRQDSMPDPDIVYVSCVFDWNGAQARGTRWMYPEAEFHLGGSGADLVQTLPKEIEFSLPDYSIYDDRGIPGWPYAMGFSTRGCNRKCPFCIVPRKEGRVSRHVNLQRIIDTAPLEAQERLLLLDNNFIQSPSVRHDLQLLAYWGGKVNFNQGIDARVLERHPDLAGLLADTRPHCRAFKNPLVTLAYDWPQLSGVVTRVCKLLDEAGFDLRHKVQWYVLVNYNTTFEQDVERVNHLRELGTNPFVMIYDRPSAPKQILQFARWANSWHIFHKVEWEDYEPGFSFRKWQEAS